MTSPTSEVFEAWTNGDLDRMRRAMSMKAKPIDRHYLLMSIVEHTYKRRADPAMAAECCRVAEIHLAEFPGLLRALRRSNDGILPQVSTFQYYATVLSEQHEYQRAIRACEAAIGFGLQDGTKAGFQGRLEAIKLQLSAQRSA